jgi:integrase
LDLYQEGLQWARRRRVELLEEKAKSKTRAEAKAPAAPPGLVVVAGWSPADIRVSDVLQNFRVRELPQLSGAAADSSRLKGLDEWFGHLTLGELTYDLLTKWKIDRASGVLGFGRISYPKGYSKNDIYRIRQALKAGKEKFRDGTKVELPAPILTPPSAQTIRHEMMLMRRALNAYFSANELNQEHGTWLACQRVMQIELPEKPEPRNTRVDEEGLVALARELNDPALSAFAQFAVMTTLRRSEVCSLRWEDLDLARRIIVLRAPGHLKKSKTSTREVPLLLPAVRILEKLGIKKKGPLFNITPSGISQAIRRAADRAGLYGLRLHDLRREGISRLLELLAASYEDVSLFSGHSDLKTLKEHYARPDPSKVRDRLEQHPAMSRMMSVK